MSIFQKGQNWYIDYYIKRQRKRKKIGPSKKLAVQVLKDVHVKIAKREYLGVHEEKKVLFEDFAIEYLEYSKANKSSSSKMRKGEILGLKWRDLDLERRKIIIMKSKNNEVRTIPINDTLCMELKKLSRNICSEYVFSHSNGEAFGSVRKSFERAVEEAGIEDFTFHDLRHTFASHLVMSGCDLRTVQQLMGHKDIKMTMRYSHLSKEHLQDAVAKLDSRWTLLWTPEGK